jgi:hypothetical protein
MEDNKKPVEETIIITQTNILPKKKRYKTIWYGEEDYRSILAMSIQQRKPMVQVAHDLIAHYYLCQKLGHEKIIHELKQERNLLAAELLLYMRHFGKLSPSARNDKRKDTNTDKNAPPASKQD